MWWTCLEPGLRESERYDKTQLWACLTSGNGVCFRQIQKQAGWRGMKVIHALKRVGSDTIMRHFLPKDVLDLLRIVAGEDVLVPSTLRKTVLQNVSCAEILRNRNLRGVIIASMRRENKEDLAEVLGVKHSTTDLDEKLFGIRLAKNSERERILFDFFEEDVPTEKKGKQVIDIETVGETPMLYDYQR